MAVRVLFSVTDQVVDHFFDCYTDMDKDGTGRIDVEKFNRYFKMDRTPFSDRIFTVVGACVTSLICL